MGLHEVYTTCRGLHANLCQKGLWFNILVKIILLDQTSHTSSSRSDAIYFSTCFRVIFGLFASALFMSLNFISWCFCTNFLAESMLGVEPMDFAPHTRLPFKGTLCFKLALQLEFLLLNVPF